MIKIRLSRLGVKNKPFYRIVAVSKEKKSNGRVLDIIGFWKPSKNDFQIDKEKLSAWVKKGALVNKSVEKLMLNK